MTRTRFGDRSSPLYIRTEKQNQQKDRTMNVEITRIGSNGRSFEILDASTLSGRPKKQVVVIRIAEPAYAAAVPQQLQPVVVVSRPSPGAQCESMRTSVDRAEHNLCRRVQQRRKRNAGQKPRERFSRESHRSAN